MIRGTTPLHIFNFPVNVIDNYENMLITYRQNNRIVLEKVLSDLDIEDNKVSVRLAQEESLLFDDGRFYVQVKVLTKEGKVQASPVFGGVVTSDISGRLLEKDTVVDPMLDIKPTDIIIRGTTPTLYYRPRRINIDNFVEAFLNVKQNGALVIERDIENAEIINDMFVWTLTQEETLALQPFSKAFISCVWKLADGTRGESRLMVCKIFNSTSSGVV